MYINISSDPSIVSVNSKKYDKAYDSFNTLEHYEYSGTHTYSRPYTLLYKIAIKMKFK